MLISSSAVFHRGPLTLKKQNKELLSQKMKYYVLLIFNIIYYKSCFKNFPTFPFLISIILIFFSFLTFFKWYEYLADFIRLQVYAEWMPRGFRKGSRRVQGGFRHDSGGIPSGFREDAERMPSLRGSR